MSLNLVRAIAKLENIDEFHLGRLLLLLQAVDKGKGKTIEGITKLAKLDFLLRYPNCLERVLQREGVRPDIADIQPFERTTIETKMIRFKYGPWDTRYRRWIGLLVARGLVRAFVQGRTVHVGLTEKGHQIAQDFATSLEFADIKLRSEIIIKTVGKFSATKLKDFIYEVFPELENMKWGEDISI